MHRGKNDETRNPKPEGMTKARMTNDGVRHSTFGFPSGFWFLVSSFFPDAREISYIEYRLRIFLFDIASSGPRGVVSRGLC